jgi:two-component system, NarL family, nitrate/nitrite response regulator NarL
MRDPSASAHPEVASTEAAGRDGRREEVRTVVAASVRLYLDGIALGLAQRGGVQVVALAADAEETVAAVLASRPDVVLLDISMDDAVSLIHSLRSLAQPPRVVAFAVDEEHDDAVLACAEAGVAGWIGRNGSLADLVDAVRHAVRGELVCSARMAGLMARRLAVLAGREPLVPDSSPLTPRELEVAELLGRGMSNKHIARTLSLQLTTVKNHVHNILAKLGASSRSEAGARLRATR